MNHTENTLLKNGWRHDAIWTHPLMYRNPLKRIPFHFDTNALLQSQYWPQERIMHFQESRLRAAFQHAYQIPFWNARFAAAHIDPTRVTMADVAKLPITSKKNFADVPASEYTRGIGSRGTWEDQTSGSTGRPFRFFHDRHYELRSLAVCERMFRTAGHSASRHILTLRARHRPGVLFGNSTFFFIKSFNDVRHRMPVFLETVASLPRPLLIQSFSSTLLELAHHLQEQKIRLSPVAILATGEGLTHQQRMFLGEAFGAPVLMGYTTRELGWLGFECGHGRLHLNEEWALVEVVDQNGVTMPPGQSGRVVVTTFDNEVMPFIRYDSGDTGCINDEPCPCGRTLRTINIRGRTVEMIKLPNRTVSLFDVAAAFDVFWRSIRQYQIVQRSPLLFHIRIVPTEGFDGIQEMLEQKLIHLLHPSAQISWEFVEAIEESAGGKAVYFIREEHGV